MYVRGTCDPLRWVKEILSVKRGERDWTDEKAQSVKSKNEIVLRKNRCEAIDDAWIGVLIVKNEKSQKPER